MAARRPWLANRPAWWLLFLAQLAPLGYLAWAVPTHQLGYEPVVDSLRFLGDTALYLLLIGLAVTPIQRLWPRLGLIDYRRMVGLYAFVYASLHLLLWLVVDRQLDLAAIWEDVVEREHITFGVIAFLLLVPLAITSTRGWMRRLGRRWKQLHRLVYPAAALVVLHYFLSVKFDTRTPLVLAGVLLLLFLARPVTRWLVAMRRRPD
ncbi:sulfoxide reductase heme-binding subunit YedZ [Guyparkeria halophila]|uniref:Protein-methionine-sulfoxide reductase heme-binding subunit MsrQ n=1 Tax=Guyparkeria halophila TaxID=47960 RepID=A0A6I6D0M1_9GAMM|nr:protein-methionine-sulfoxide reductase heme-binding subunit MsrQ [Guyparkeria halophila]QGT79260.1 sulfoxide reductase heme-binding subunit YedZ [Guyparkeria halophila]